MKKFTAIFFALVMLLSFNFGCAKQRTLTTSVTELQFALYEGTSQSYTLKAGYGYVTQNDEKVYYLTVKMIGREQDSATYSLTLTRDNQDYQADFALNPVSGALTAKIEIENLPADKLEVNVTTASQTETVTLQSIVPNGTATYKVALDSLLKSQPELIKNYSDGDTFTGSIAMRLLVKNGNAYWYVGLSDGKSTKAMLIDGKTLEVLAIRDIF